MVDSPPSGAHPRGASLSDKGDLVTEAAQPLAPTDAAASWLGRFEKALGSGSGLDEVFTEDAHWRDAVAFTWDILTVSGGPEIARILAARQPAVSARMLALSTEPVAQVKVRGGRTVVEAFFDFVTSVGKGRGVVRIPWNDSENEDLRALTLLTSLAEVDGFPEPTRENRPRGGIYANNFGGPSWADHRALAQEYTDRSPEVLILGGGQAGMTLAARLGRLGVDALIVDKNDRAGDNWRHRYDSLALHNESWVCELPYMPYPPTWPVYLPKEMIAGWMETYAWAMELNYWTSTELISATFDEPSGRWTVELMRDGHAVVLKPQHFVMATGMSGAPKMPQIEGLAKFTGEVAHTSEFSSGAGWTGRRALVIGTGNSAHDVAQDLHSHGAHVTMVQRGATTITSVEPAAQLVFALYSEGPSTEDCDLLSVSMPYELFLKGQQMLTKKMLDLDRPLIEKLDTVGFRTDIGDDESGYYMKYLRTGGGYYLNVGCSELIAEGQIDIVAHERIVEFDAHGVRLVDGTTLNVDLVVLATGYENMQETTRRILGDEIADRVGPVWGYDEYGDMRNVWKRTAQPNLWYMAGSFAQCRTYSRYLAQQIYAVVRGVQPVGPYERIVTTTRELAH